jgi:hypothetical protein
LDGTLPGLYQERGGKIMEALETFEKWWEEVLVVEPGIAPYKLLFKSGFYAGAAYGSEKAIDILRGKKK